MIKNKLINHQEFLKKGCATVALSGLLVACGGSGGGDSAPQNTVPGATVNISTQAEARTVTRDFNENDAGVSSVDTVSFLRSVNDQESRNIPNTVKGIILGLNIQSNGISRGYTRAQQTISCSGGGSMTVTGSESNGTVVFVECVEFFSTMNGTVSYSASASGDITTKVDDYSSTVSMSFTGFTMTIDESGFGGGISEITMSGTFNLSESYDASQNTWTGAITNSTFTESFNGVSTNVYALNLNWTQNGDSNLVTSEISGTFEDDLGIYSVVMLEPIQQVDGSYPHTGKFQLLGFESSVTVTIQDTNNVLLETDTDGDGETNTSETVRPWEVGYTIDALIF